MADDWKNKANTGLWTVLGPYVVTPKGEKKYLCRCDCGTERYVLERSLRYGGSKSCGCETRKRALQVNAYDLNGREFEDLKVLYKAQVHKKDKRGGIWWHCRCSCGNEIDVLASLLVTGRKTHCGCKADPKYHYVDIADRAFEHLTAKYIVKREKGTVYWHCICDCGNEVDISYNDLVYSNRKSCGCKKEEHEQNLGRLLTHIDGTSLDMIKSKKLPTDNTSGVKGVYYQKGKWIAKIVFQQKQYHLGQYENIEDAAKARKEAEELLFDGVAAHYARWKAKADTDPEWAVQNPVKILVTKKSTSELAVTLLPKVI